MEASHTNALVDALCPEIPVADVSDKRRSAFTTLGLCRLGTRRSLRNVAAEGKERVGGGKEDRLCALSWITRGSHVAR